MRIARIAVAALVAVCDAYGVAASAHEERDLGRETLAPGAYNEVNDPDLVDGVSSTPTLFLEIDPTKKALELVKHGAGPFWP